ncbi:MAG: hypothetical protein AAGA75_20555 [Cyanobacteria bacterium P01_E01_bin.6]
MSRRFILDLAGGHIATAIKVTRDEDLWPAFNSLGLQVSSPVLVVVGGASKLGEDDFARLKSLFECVLAPMAQALNMIVIDGGTDAGVMKLIGQARSNIGGTFPLLGVAPVGLADFPNTPFELANDPCALEPHHTHFILVPGSDWGNESPWIAKIATALAKDKPSIAILANGGEITWKDAQQNVDAHRPVIVVEGSGRTADVLAHALDGEIIDDRAKALIDSQLLRSIDMAEDFQSISQTLYQILETH